ncbi:G-box-binding factor 1-like isoform X3 [Rhododendron vialii]|uniref:G-box-binding factor 1-like isoform X3 n=1 Tax=Rhododendron vialii TaxID=182163 RepID=UPI00265D7442|nr:G-box-binding factor 1-like isoform X3 [Rhododendron vialii]XP_058190605.1 G-box-binding factor 1-like isoform X3 [Rhododendron vialii]
METEGVGSPAKPPKLMANGEDAKPVKSSKRTISTQERTLAPQPDWSAFMQMQAYNSARHIPPLSSNPNFSASHPYMWGNEGWAFKIPEAEGKVFYGTDWKPMRKCTGSLGGVGFVGERSGESAKTTGSSRIDRDIGSGIASTSHDSDKAKHEECPVMKKRCFDQMLADEANVDDKNTVTANYGGAKHQVLLQGDKLLYMPASKGDRGISSKGSSPASKFMMKNPNKPSGASEPVASAKMVAREKVMSARQIQDVPKLLDERRNLQNKEAARRLRDRRKERKEIEAKADTLRRETSMLTKTLTRYSEMCLELKDENDCLLEELKRMDEANAFSALKAKDPYPCLQLVREDNNNGRNQESSSDHKSSLTDPSTPDT